MYIYTKYLCLLCAHLYLETVVLLEPFNYNRLVDKICTVHSSLMGTSVNWDNCLIGTILQEQTNSIII